MMSFRERLLVLVACIILIALVSGMRITTN